MRSQPLQEFNVYSFKARQIEPYFILKPSLFFFVFWRPKLLMLSNLYSNFTNSWMNFINDKSINIDKTNIIQHFSSRGHIHLLKPYLFGLKHLGYLRNFLGIQSVPRLKVDFILIYNTRWLNTHPQVILKIGSRKVSILQLCLWLWRNLLVKW